MPNINIYSHACFLENPYEAIGYGVIVKLKDATKTFSKGFQNTTINRVEMQGIIDVLTLYNNPCKFTVYTESRYIVDGIEKGWARNWRRNGWKKYDGSPAKNRDLWERLLDLTEYHKVKFVRNHENMYMYLERCHELAYWATLAQTHK